MSCHLSLRILLCFGLLYLDFSVDFGKINEISLKVLHLISSCCNNIASGFDCFSIHFSKTHFSLNHDVFNFASPQPHPNLTLKYYCFSIKCFQFACFYWLPSSAIVSFIFGFSLLIICYVKTRFSSLTFSNANILIFA